MSLFNHFRTSALLAALILVLPVWLHAQDRGQTEQELAAVAEAIGEIQTWLQDAGSRYSEAEQRLRHVELAIDATAGRVTALQTSLTDTRSRLDSLSAQQSRLEAAQARQSEALAEILRAAYMAGNAPLLKLLLNQQDPSAAARILHYTRLFSEQQLERIQQYQQTLDDLDAVATELTATLAQLNNQQQALDAELASLNEAKAEREQALAALDSDINSRRSQLEQLQIDQAELQALLDEIIRAMEGVRSFADVPPFAEQRGALPLPVNGTLNSRFGETYGGGSLSRQGIVLAASPGTPVRAVHPGRVVFADWLRGAGLLVIVDHGNDYMSLYGGNEALGVSAGDWVDRGDVLATSGPGVASAAPGLYFEIRRQGQAVNPGQWLAD